MTEMKKIATRDSYGNTLVELGREHEDLVVLDADLANATKTIMFRKEFPQRHIDCGIAECNMMCIAAGLDLRLPAWCRLRALLRCSPQDARLSRSATPSAIRT